MEMGCVLGTLELKSDNNFRWTFVLMAWLFKDLVFGTDKNDWLIYPGGEGIRQHFWWGSGWGDDLTPFQTRKSNVLFSINNLLISDQTRRHIVEQPILRENQSHFQTNQVKCILLPHFRPNGKSA